MEDLSLHILDIAENSMDAGARIIEIVIREDSANDLLVVEVTDDGKGMDAETIRRVTDPFYTTRTTRKVGMGLPLLNEAAKAANGHLEIQSFPGRRTTVTATFQRSHIDCKPLGSMADTIVALVARGPDIEIMYRHESDGRAVTFSTSEVRRRLKGLPVNAVEILNFITQYLRQEENSFHVNTKE